LVDKAIPVVGKIQEVEVITLTRLNQSQLVVNADLIEFLEATPDTVVTLVTARKLLVRESVEEVVERIIEFRKRVGCSVLNIGGAISGSSEIET
jgi:flagellar protein FlbD